MSLVLMDQINESDLTPEHRASVRKLRDQFFSVECLAWDEAKGELRIFVRQSEWIDEEKRIPTNGNRYVLYEHTDGQMYRKLMQADWTPYYPGSPGFPIDPKPAPAKIEKASVAVPRKRPRRAVAEVVDLELPDTVRALFIKRAEILDEVRGVELAFTRDPSLPNLIKLQAARDAMFQLEQRIVALNSIEKRGGD